MIARQHECPAHMSTQEYKSLALLALGHRTRWQNILRCLAMPKADMKRPETALILLQISIQVGIGADTAMRQSHRILEYAEFTEKMMVQLKQGLERIKQNWECSSTLWILTILTSRILAIGHPTSREDCLQFLASCREVASRWLMDLECRVVAETKSSQRAEFANKVVEIALVCAETFNVGGTTLFVLLQNEREATTLLRCSVLISKYMLGLDNNDQVKTMMVFNWKRLLLTALPVLLEIVTQSNCLNRVITPGSGSIGSWYIESKYWVRHDVIDQIGSRRQIYQFNLLTAEVLVDGFPIGKLPRDIEVHEQYHALFGQSRFDVVPATEMGMLYKITTTIQDHEVSLGLAKPSLGAECDLVLTAWKDGRRFDLIPASVLGTNIPKAFSQGNVLWFESDSGQLELRPVHSPWESNDSNWRFRRYNQGWQLCSNDRILVGPSSQTTTQFATIFEPLAFPEDMHVLYFECDQRLEIHIPNLQLEFVVEHNSHYITSRQFRGMHVDSCQHIDTLIGLRQMLTLCATRGNRMVIIPDGEINCYQSNMGSPSQHVTVTIDVRKSRRFFNYELDRHLERLVGTDLQSKFVLAYLHAVTSYCLPDPFTNYTGTEQALLILRSSEVRSFQTLSPSNYATLVHISRLTERRRLSNPSVGKLQVVSWNDALSCLCHHHEFQIIVQQIFAQAAKYSFLHPKGYIEPPQIDNNESVDLEQRNMPRASIFCTMGFGAELVPIACDRTYVRRRDDGTGRKFEVEDEDDEASESDAFEDQERGGPILDGGRPYSDRFKRAFRTCFTVAANLPQNQASVFKAGIFNTFTAKVTKTLKGSPTTKTLGPLTTNSYCFDYDASLLDDPSTFLPNTWFQIFNTLREPKRKLNSYQATFYLATLSFSELACMEIVQILASTMCLPSDALDTLDPAPQVNSLDLHKG